MKIARALLLGAAAAPLFLASTAAQAVAYVSLDRASFQAALAGGAINQQNFDSFADQSILLDDGEIAYSASTGQPLITNDFLVTSTPNGLGRSGVGFFLEEDSATFTFDTARTAFAIDINTFATANGAYQLSFNTGDTATSIFETFPGFGTGQFIGVLTATPFTSVTLSNINNAGNATYTLDTLLYGDAARVQGAIPEPSTWGLLIAGFAAVGLSLRSSRRRLAAA